ncbi:MAG: hypothetical protein ACR2MB_02005, partial [Acidimicrobiales bacterium]
SGTLWLERTAMAKQATPAKKAPTTKAPAKKTSAKKRSAPKVAVEPIPVRPDFPEAWLTGRVAALHSGRAVFLHQADVLEAEAESLVADFEPGDVQFDEESGEGDSLSTERERDLVLSAQARAAIIEIDHALAKFDAGTYGICEVAGDITRAERLKAIPWVRECVQHKIGGFGRRT